MCVGMCVSFDTCMSKTATATDFPIEIQGSKTHSSFDKMLLFIMNVGHEQVKIIKCCTVVYLTLAPNDNFSKPTDSNQESVIANILAALDSTYSKMSFPCHHATLRKVLLQDAKILTGIQEKVNCLIRTFENIMSSSLDDRLYKIDRDE